MEPAAMTQGGSARILVIDDDSDVLQVIRGVLEDEGLIVDVAVDGQRALEIADRHKPDLVVLDVTLPVVDSDHVAARLRSVHGASMPVLVITADGRAPQKARKLGAYGYLRKPFELTQLIAAVQRGLDRHRDH